MCVKCFSELVVSVACSRVSFECVYSVCCIQCSVCCIQCSVCCIQCSVCCVLVSVLLSLKRLGVLECLPLCVFSVFSVSVCDILCVQVCYFILCVSFSLR